MADKLMYVPNYDAQNYSLWLNGLDTQRNTLINQNSMKVPKVFEPTSTQKKTLLQNLVD